MRMRALNELLVGAIGSDWPEISKAQTASFLTILKQIKEDKNVGAALEGEAKVWLKMLSSMAAKIRQEDHDLLVNEIAEALARPKGGWKLQKFVSLSFLEDEEWDRFLTEPIWTLCTRILFDEALTLESSDVSNSPSMGTSVDA